MSKLSLIIKTKKKLKLISKFIEIRKKNKHLINNLNTSNNDRLKAIIKLQSLPRNSSPVRHRNRCFQTGRPRSFIRRFGLSRLKFRELALKGEIPGLKKSSW